MLLYHQLFEENIHPPRVLLSHISCTRMDVLETIRGHWYFSGSLPLNWLNTVEEKIQEYGDDLPLPPTPQLWTRIPRLSPWKALSPAYADILARTVSNDFRTQYQMIFTVIHRMGSSSRAHEIYLNIQSSRWIRETSSKRKYTGERNRDVTNSDSMSVHTKCPSRSLGRGFCMSIFTS